MATASALALAGPAAAQAAAPAEVAPVTVVAASPLPGTAIDADKLAGVVQTLSVPRLTESRRSDVLPNLVAAQLPGVSVNEEQGSRFQPDFVFRGFEASPIGGMAQGLAVYQDGVRLNESFGDNVNWDLVPQFAVDDVTVQSNNPVFGLNALGGAVTLAMKDGLSFQGAQAEVSGGSFGEVGGHVELGRRLGDFGVYLGAGAQHEDGFRYLSPTTLRQVYGDLAYQRGPLTLHLSGEAARNDIDAVGPTPVELLAADPRAVFTNPQSMRNAARMVQLRGSYAAADHLTLSANLYYRRFDQRLVDGNTTNAKVCDNAPDQLCFGGDNLYPADALHDAASAAVPASVLPDGAIPGEIDFTHTRTDSYGAALQVALSAPLGGHANAFTAGLAVDRGETRYGAYGELGALQDNLTVLPVGVVIDQALSPTASPPIFAPVDVAARNTYLGLYAIDVLDLTPKLSLTLSGRWNRAHIRLRDRMGGGVEGDHRFDRFNPGAGVTYKLAPRLTAYLGYSEANRAPTAGELSCADPASPCLLDAFLVADPPLKQVVARTVEGGVRGRFKAAGLDGAFTWNLSAFRTRSQDDILLVASQINGFGYFQNAGDTARVGLDANLAYRGDRLSARLGYGWLDAAFRSAEALASNSPAADDQGLIHVRPGDRLPMIPAHRITATVDYDVTPSWSLGADLRWQSGQYLVGDESNQEPKLPGYATANLHAAWRLGPRLQLFGEIQNLFDARYYTYGAFTELDGLPPNVALTNPRTYSPAEGRAVTVGARLRFE
jgi:iron complex outermembrane receptor protein